MNDSEDTFYRLKRIPFDQVLDIATAMFDEIIIRPENANLNWDPEILQILDKELEEKTGWTWTAYSNVRCGRFSN